MQQRSLYKEHVAACPDECGLILCQGTSAAGSQGKRRVTLSAHRQWWITEKEAGL